ncbi:MAG: hypothetical protein J6A92_04710 [Lachnospiraceae bacterium]|nr:hypothetical protein [Lachnospiraceae bacterium]
MKKAIEIVDFPTTDYKPLVEYENWRVAVLAYCENTTPKKILTMQKHEETDEVFVLVRGKATLITAGDREEPDEISFTELKPYKVYTVKKGFWHNHVLDKEGVVLIVENADTSDDNSPIKKLSQKQIETILGTLL